MQHTKGPWAWRDFGGLALHGEYGSRPVVLAPGMDNSLGDWDPPGKSLLYVRGPECHLVPLTPDHPDARLIAAAPDLLAACNALEDVLSLPGREAGLTEREREAVFAARRAIARAFGA